jgi:hypothetical protein
VVEPLLSLSLSGLLREGIADFLFIEVLKDGKETEKSREEREKGEGGGKAMKGNGRQGRNEKRRQSVSITKEGR